MTLRAETAAALTDIYDTALNPGRWRRALDGVSTALDARAVSLLIRRPDPKASDLLMLSTRYLKFTRTAWGLYYGLRLARLQEPDWDHLSRQPAHAPTLDVTVRDPAELDARADYALLRKRLGLRRRLGVKLNPDRMWFDAISVAYPEAAQGAPDWAMTQLDLLLPHLTKAVEIGRAFAMLRAKYRATLSALDKVEIGMAIAAPDGSVILTNAAADRMLDAKDGLSLGADKHLRAADPEITAAAEDAIRHAAQATRGAGGHAERLLSAPKRSGEAPWLIDIAPLKDSKADLPGPIEGALITLIDPARPPTLRLDRFVTTYGLTSAEAEVCGLLLSGSSVEEIAERRNTTPVTAKNQVNAILAKTGSHRRADLVRLAVRVMPPVG